MSDRTISSVVIICFVLGLGTCLQADSIWSKRDQSKKDLYADDKARHIGDILTILIIEESTVENKIKRTLSKETTRSANFNGGVSLEHILPEVPSLKLGGGTTYTGTDAWRGPCGAAQVFGLHRQHAQLPVDLRWPSDAGSRSGWKQPGRTSRPAWHGSRLAAYQS